MARIYFPETLLNNDGPDSHPSIIRFRAFDRQNDNANVEILLPVPIALNNSYAVQFDDLESGLLSKSIQETVGAAQNFSSDIGLGTFVNEFGDAAGAIGIGAGAALLGNFDAARRIGGFSFNKSGQLTINRPSNRSYNFRFEFIPKNRSEAKTVQTIIEMFKYAMHPPVPDASENFVYLNPARFLIDFLYNPGQSENTKIFSSYFSFLTGFEVNQHNAGAPSYYENGVPTNRSISLSFQELSPLNRQNIQALEPVSDSSGLDAANSFRGTRSLENIAEDITVQAGSNPGTQINNIRNNSEG